MGKMKDSGFEWVGQIPKEWNLSKIKYEIIDLYSGGTPESGNYEFYDDNGECWVAIGDMSNSNIVYNTESHITKAGVKDKNLKLIPKGTILYSIYATIGKVSKLGTDAYINQALLALYPKSTLNKEYLKYTLKFLEQYALSECSTSIQNNLNALKVKNFPILQLCLEEQQLIVSFLDDKVGKIDEILKELNNQIEILNRYKKSLITETVTKGIDSNIEMKDRGIDWIGKIPVHWQYKKIGYVAFVTKLAGFEFTDYFNYEAGGDVIAIRGLNLKNFSLDLSDIQTITEEVSNKLLRSQIVKNNILVSYAGSVGNIGFIEDDNYRYHLAPNVGKIEIKNSKIYPKYVAYYLISFSGQEEIDNLKNKNAQESISMENLRKVKILIPELKEQQEIVNYLDKKCAQIDELIVDKQKQIEKMEKYKKSLIYEYVTGKKRVKGAEELYG